MFKRLRTFGLVSLVAVPAFYWDVQTEANAQRQSVGEMRRNMQRRAEENRAFHRRNAPLYQQWREQSARQDAEARRRGPSRGGSGVSR